MPRTAAVHPAKKSAPIETFPSFGEYNADFVHPRIAVGSCMRPQFVPILKANGIRAIVNAMGVAQKSHFAYLAALPETIHWQLLAFWDGSAAFADQKGGHEALAPDHARVMVEVIARIVRERSPVLIHCGGGIGRSGNLAGIIVAALENIPAHEAIWRMRRYRPRLGDFSYDHLWKNSDVPELVKVAAKILRQKKNPASICMTP
jgi:hypothetical protein